MTIKIEPKQDNNPSPRQPYEAPRLETYGNLADLTQALATTTMNDKGSGSGTMT